MLGVYRVTSRVGGMSVLVAATNYGEAEDKFNKKFESTDQRLREVSSVEYLGELNS